MALPEEQPVVWAIRFTDRASDDDPGGVKIISWKRQGMISHEAWSKGLIAEVAKLAQFPTIWPVAEEDKLFKQSVRRLLYRRTKRGPAYRVPLRPAPVP